MKILSKSRLSLIIILISLLNSSIQAQTLEIWGTTHDGGSFEMGTLFKTDKDGNNHSIQSNMKFYRARSPQRSGLCEASNGKIYGLSYFGGMYNDGAIFEYNPATGEYKDLYSFSNFPDGENPNGTFIEASNGKLYGLTKSGGNYGSGVLFEYDFNTETFTKKVDFSGTSIGSNPLGNLTEASNGLLYGMTRSGGAYGKGVIFEYDPASNTCIKKHEFDGTTTGSSPEGSLTETSSGNLYGLTSYGGINNLGTLFLYDFVADTIINKFDFDGAAHGSKPLGHLVYASNNMLYGLTSYGGAPDYGVLFKFDPTTDICTKIADFDSTAEGKSPNGSLAEASNGMIYGMTSYGGTYSDGVIFEFNPITDTCIKKVDFNGTFTGSNPRGSLMQASDGTIYGMTTSGGISNYGALFRYNLVFDDFQKILNFQGNNGDGLSGPPMYASNGKIYGMSNRGGVSNNGVLYEFNPQTDKYSVKQEFTGIENGSYPYGSLCEASNNLLYGLTSHGGNSDKGVLFEYNPITDTLIKKVNFDGTNTGSIPLGTLVNAPNGKLYGMTSSGGALFGVLFEYDPATEVFTKKIDFTGSGNGANPNGSLILTANGKLFGMTSYGGAYGSGMLFEYDYTTNTLSKKVDFIEATSGTRPYGALTESSGGKLYGMTSAGGAYSYGALFEYDPIIDTLIVKMDLDSATSGSDPCGTPLFASNGKIYGLTTHGGSSNNGVMFEYDPTSDILIKKNDFTGTNGRTPLYTGLIETNICYNTSDSITIDVCNSYTVPSGDEIYTIPGIYYDTIPNTCGSDSIITITLSLRYSTYDTISSVECFTYTSPSGTVFTLSGIYSDTIPNMAGCDSIITINLTINNVDTSVTVNGTTLTANAVGAIYQWLDCDNAYSPISGETMQSYTPTNNGNYAVEITENGCADTSTCYGVLIIGIENTDNDLVIYPNPNDGSFYISNLAINAEIKLTDVLGNEIISKTIKANENIITIENIEPGLYFLIYRTNNKQKTYKIFAQ